MAWGWSPRGMWSLVSLKMDMELFRFETGHRSFSSFYLHSFRTPIQQLLPQQFLRWQVEAVFPGVDVGVGRQGEFDDGLFLPFTEQDADGGVFVGGFHEAVEVVHIHLHLPQILMAELVEFEVDDHIAAQQTVVEDEIDEEVVFVEGETLLASLEEKSLAQFQQEVFELVDDGGFQVGFGIAHLFVKAKEF